MEIEGVKRYSVISPDSQQEVVTIVMEPGACIPFHNHGESHGKVKYLIGDVGEYLVDPASGLPCKVIMHSEGDVAAEGPNTIHSVWNPSETQRAVFQIEYKPAIRDTMTFFSLQEIVQMKAPT